MTLPLPKLDDRTFEDLVDEARTLIRTYEPAWTNHNPSDPGMTLIELFAWLAEMLIYRADQVPDRHRLAFLQLLNGPEWKPSVDSVDDEIATTLADVRRRYRAVTAEDHEILARETSAQVARALCVAQRDLGRPDAAGRAQPRPGYVSIVVLPVERLTDAEAATLREAVLEHLEPRRLLTTQHVVAPPVWTPIACDVLVQPRADVLAPAAVAAVTRALIRFMDPYTGGLEGTGWPFGRDVYDSELYRVIEALPEIDSVPGIELESSCPGGEDRCEPAPALWNADGDHTGRKLAPHALPRMPPDAIRVTTGSFVPVTVAVSVTARAGQDVTARRSTRAALRALFHPRREGRDGLTQWSTTAAVIRTELGTPAGVAAVGDVVIRADPRHLAADERDELVLILFEGELVDLQLRVEVVASP